MSKTYSATGWRIGYIIAPEDISNAVRKVHDFLTVGAPAPLQEAGVVTVSQTPLLKGVNSDPLVLGDLFNKLSYIGVPPCYIFQCRPAIGNRGFALPLEAGFEIFEQARMQCSGLAKRARFVMSHASGKVEVVGIDNNRIYMRYHRAANYAEKARFFAFKRNPQAYWFDDYREVVSVHSISNPTRDCEAN
jgi:L-lysine 2,3-aminomutase